VERQACEVEKEEGGEDNDEKNKNELALGLGHPTLSSSCSRLSTLNRKGGSNGAQCGGNALGSPWKLAQ